MPRSSALSPGKPLTHGRDVSTMLGIVAPERNNRTLDWREELRWLQPKLRELPAEARRAVLEAVAHFRAEDAEGSRLDEAA